MRNFHDIFETRKRSFMIDFSICMTVPLTKFPKPFVNILKSDHDKRSINNINNDIKRFF